MKNYENLDLQDLDREVWKDIEEYPDYQISNYGRVKRVIPDMYNRKMKILKQCIMISEHLRVGLTKDKKSKLKLVHILMYKSFIGEVPKGYDIHHIDEKPKNNTLDNFQLIPHSEHMRLHNTGKIVSDESKKKISKKQKIRYITEKGAFSGKHHTEETKKILSEKKLGKYLGENHPNHKIKESDVIQIRLLKLKKFTNKKISEILNISKYIIEDINSGRSWKHLL